jgi:hypothetical protein
MKVNQTLYPEYVSLQLICNKDQVNPQAPVAHAEGGPFMLSQTIPDASLTCILRLCVDSDSQLLCADGWLYALCRRGTLPHTTA